MKPFDALTIAGITAHLEREDDFVFLESSRVTGENHQSLLFRQPHQRLICTRDDNAEEFLAAADELRKDGFFLAGWLAYEFSYLFEPRLRSFLGSSKVVPEQPLAVLGVYDAPLVYDHATSQFSGSQAWPIAEGNSSACSCSRMQPAVSRTQYLQAVRTIKEYITAGDTYQVNFTLPLDFQFSGSVAAFYQALRRNQSVSYGAWIRQGGRDILCFSPELFFRTDSAGIRVRPMKGTLARGRTTVEDEQLCEQLRGDPKNRSENVMIVDLLRNDLGRLLHENGGGTVVPQSLFDVETYESLLQMTSTVDAVPADNKSFSFKDLIRSLFPCGSVTGAPKIRTMEIIHELELQPRGVYCGSIGYAGPETSCFNVPIRTLMISGNTGTMGIGAGIVADSDPEAEWQECLLKGNFLSRDTPEFQLIETLLWQRGSGFFLLEYHLQRLADSARYFHFVFDLELITFQLQEAAASCSNSQRVRMLLHRDGRVDVQCTELAVQSKNVELPEVIFSSTKVDPASPHLYHKTTLRSLFDNEYRRAAELGCLDVLFTNPSGQVTEGAISNVFIRRQGRLLTPPVHCGLLAGTYRRMLLEQGRAVEQILTREDVMGADEVCIANSVRGLVKVRVREE